MMTGVSEVFGAIVLIAAGVYQWTSLKEICLENCQAPFAFIQRHGGFGPEARRSLHRGLCWGGYCGWRWWSLLARLFVVGVVHRCCVAAASILVVRAKPVADRA